MQPEKEDGNIEYKLKLLDLTPERTERLATQMRYRCDEGGSECIYNLGVEDDGTITGITEQEYESTIKCVKSAAQKNSYNIFNLTQTEVENGRSIYEVLIREKNDDSYIDIKVAIAGSVDCGKSTLLSVLTNGKKDNGRGSARLAVFNFPHEVATGRTSSIGHQILGYNNTGEVLNYQNGRVLSWPNIVKRSSKIISFYDLAGHEKYLKTTIFGLSASVPDMCMIMVGANRGVLKMTREHIFLCKTLGIPFCIIVTKIDMVKELDNILEDTLTSINIILKKPGIRRIPIRVKTKGDIIRCALNIHTETIVPIFLVSNVSLEGIPELHQFLNLLPKKNITKNTDDVECRIDSSWVVPGVGTVVGGHLISGTIKIGDKLWFGPNNNKYIQITVRSIHCKKVSIQQTFNNCYICLAVKGISKCEVHKGNVLVKYQKQQILCNKLVAAVEVLHAHSTTIKVGYQPVMHAHNVRTCVIIEDVVNKISSRYNKTDTDKILRIGDSADISLKLCYGMHFIKPGTNILLCEGRTKVVGYVKSVNIN